MFKLIIPVAHIIPITGKTVYEANTIPSTNDTPTAFTWLTYILSCLMLIIFTGSFMLS